MLIFVARVAAFNQCFPLASKAMFYLKISIGLNFFMSLKALSVGQMVEYFILFYLIVYLETLETTDPV